MASLACESAMNGYASLPICLQHEHRSGETSRLAGKGALLQSISPGSTRLNLSAHFASQRLCVKLQTSNIKHLHALHGYASTSHFIFPPFAGAEMWYNILVLAWRGSRREAGSRPMGKRASRAKRVPSCAGNSRSGGRNPDKAIRFLRCGLRLVDTTRKRCWNLERRK